MSDKVHNYLRFRVGHEWYGVDVGAVIEVLHLVALSEVPGTDVLGLMTLRDMVMPVVDLRKFFGLPEANLKLDTPIIAVTTPSGNMGLLVDEADDVRQISGDALIPYKNQYVNQVARLENGLLMLLDLGQLHLRYEHL